jgi:hypothetical protein
MNDNGKWVKLELGNDWGTEYYAHKALDDGGFASLKRAINFTEGQPVVVRWPDGSTSAEVLTLRKFHTSVMDMGHTYPTSYMLAVIDKTVLGLKRDFFLSEVEIWEEN